MTYRDEKFFGGPHDGETHPVDMSASEWCLTINRPLSVIFAPAVFVKLDRSYATYRRIPSSSNVFARQGFVHIEME